jgi:hypothetical protein
VACFFLTSVLIQVKASSPWNSSDSKPKPFSVQDRVVPDDCKPISLLLCVSVGVIWGAITVVNSIAPIVLIALSIEIVGIVKRMINGIAIICGCVVIFKAITLGSISNGGEVDFNRRNVNQ